MKRPTTAKIIDELGAVRTQLAELTEKERRLRESLIATGLSEGDGKLFHVAITHFEVNQIDYKRLLAKLKPNPRTIKACTVTTQRTMVTTSSCPS